MGLFDKMSYDEAFAVLKSAASSKGELKKAEKVMSKLPLGDRRWVSYMFLCLIRCGHADSAYDMIKLEENKGELSEMMLSTMKLPIVFSEFLSAYQCSGRLLPGVYVARAYENGWGTEKNHEKAVEIVQAWGEVSGTNAEEANKIRNKILSVEEKEPAAAPKTIDTIFGKVLVEDKAATPAPVKTEYKRIKFDNGDVYEGEYVGDTKHGHGKYTLADGTYFDGEWKDNKRQGHFVYTEKLGEFLQQYEGEFVDDKPDGKHIGFTVGSTSDKRDFHVYENGKFIVGISATDENRNMTAAELIKQHREYRRKSNAEIGLDEHGYPLPTATPQSAALVSDHLDLEDYYSAAQAAWDRDDYFRCCYYMRCAGKMYGEHQFRYQTAHYYCRGDKEGKAYQIVKDLMCNKNLSDISYADASFCLYLFKEFIPHETDFETMAKCHYRIGDIKSAARWMPMSRLFFIRNGEVYSTEDLLAGKGGNAFPLADEIMAFRLLQKALGLWKRGKCSKDLKYFAEQVDDSAKIINKYIQCAKNGSQQYRLSEIVEQTNLLRSEIKDYLW